MRTERKPVLNFTEASKTILSYECAGNKFNISSLNQYYSPVDSSGFAVKYVAEGIEKYVVDGQPYYVTSGNYLLMNGNKSALVEIDSKTEAKGICVNIASQIIKEVVASKLRPDTAVADPELSSFFYTDQFLENQYQAAFTRLGSRIIHIGKEVQGGILSLEEVNNEFFYTLAEDLVADQISVYRQLQTIPVVKLNTRRDLYRKLVLAREFMDLHFLSPLTIEQIAREAAMSEFHFFRLFKRTFAISPLQYLLKKRLEQACILLKKGMPVTLVAMECGFGDLFSFSRTFKKHFGKAPSQYQRL